MKKETLCIFAILMLLASQIAVTNLCASTHKPEGELKIGLTTLYTQTFHPFRNYADIKIYITPLFDYLVGLDEDGRLQPGIAYQWKESPDHLRWTFYIRDRVRFHDGTPLSLDDIKFSLDTILDEKNVNARTLFAPYLKRVEIEHPNKILVYLKKPWSTFLYQLSKAGVGGGIILPKNYIERNGVESFNEHPIGTGPYRFLEKKEGDFIKYEAQGHHWRIGTPGYKYMTFRNIPEESTRIAALRRGELDVAMISRARVGELEKAGCPIVSKEASFDLQLFFIGTTEPDNPLSKREVRQALVYAIDKPAILKHIFMGRGKLIGHSFYMNSGSLSLDKTIPISPYDPKMAKELLSKAGYSKGFTIYHYVHQKKVPEVSTLAEVIASYWGAIGIKTKILEVDPSTFKAVYTRKKKAPGPASVVWVVDSEPTSQWRPIFHSNHQRYSWSRFGDATMDKLIEAFDNQIDLEGYIKADRECEKYVREQYWISGIVGVNSPFATARNVPGWNCGRGNRGGFRFEYIGAKK